MVAFVVSRIVLKGKAAFEFETRTLNPERAAHFLADFFAFIAPLTLSNFKSEFNAIVALISKIVVSSIAVFATSILSQIHIESLITDCLEFSQHCHGFISVCVKKSFQLLTKKCYVSLQHSDLKYLIKSGKAH